ncbi:MAG: DEAD/DEAH box helicase family protein [Deltaproteobacteria bacterium]|nr:DEAD/DEAH box helicase family protein [Deltaproteobacteria bacterium]
MFKLKDYQRKALDTLESFLVLARTGDVKDAFKEVLKNGGENEVPYREYSFGQVPYVCLRLPTGGGKTVLASHTVKVAARSYLEQDYPIVLWLVPTNTIREQTLKALAQPGHPYRAELDRYFDYQVRILNIDDVTQIQAQDVGNKAIVIVSTIANLRVNDTSGRKVYAYNEHFESHFASVNPNDKRLERVTEEDLKENGLDRSALGKIKKSFANILALNEPLVIIDEAHNARTRLTHKTLHRIHPKCIVEFTATPDTSVTSASNVIYHVSALELKAQQMIKLPIMLTEHAEWQASVRDAVLTRTKLAQEAQKEEDYIRPIVLFQAEAKNGEITVEVLKEFLIENLKIDAHTIAVATGTQRELDNMDIFAPECPIEHIITIEALKEGWDCSFAYVFCSVKEVRSMKDAEQLLGRVLRMPFAKRRKTEALNRAYAHLCSSSFAQAAHQLTDRLVNMGFEELEIAANLQAAYGQSDLFGGDPAEYPAAKEPPLEIRLPQAPDLEGLNAEDRTRIEVSQVERGDFRVKVAGSVDEALSKVLLANVDNKVTKEYKVEIALHNARLDANRAPAQRGEHFMPLPQLCFGEQGQLSLLEPEAFRYISGDWSLLDFTVELPGFTISEKETTFEVDIDGKKMSYHVAEESETYDLNLVESGLSESDLALVLSREVCEQNIAHSEIMAYLTRLIAHLVKERGFTLTALIRVKYPLIRAIRAQISVIQDKAASKGFQQVLFENKVPLEASLNYEYRFEPGLYPARFPYYRGRYKFQKHYYPIIEDLKESDASDTEFACARAIDNHPKVKFWVRNLVQRDHASFRLPLANNWFYPDFVAELNDERLLVVEYKGEGYKTTDDSREKKAVGEYWAKSSGGKCFFLFAVEKDDKGRDVYGQLGGLLG